MAKQPNILYIMSDDHSANAISCYGSILSEVFKTPGLDRLANEGSKLNCAFSTNSICTPARATVMTGQYGHINGVRTLSDHYDADNCVNIAKIFQSNGYQTSIFGKWHLHCKPAGFDEYKVLSNLGGQGSYQFPEFIEKDKEDIVVYDNYVTDVITEMATSHIKSLDEDKPFFMMMHHKAPHDFWEYPVRHEHMFDGVDIPVPDSLFENREHRNVASRDFGSSVTPRSAVRSLYEDFSAEDYVTGKLETTEDMSFEEKGIAAYQKYLKDYLRTVAGVDDSVAEVYKVLEETGKLDDTIIIYTSDQGMFLGEHDYQDKRWSFEESLRIPFLIRYPERIKAGIPNENLISNIDIAPTLLDFCGIEVPSEMQGVSQVETITTTDADDINEYIYFRYWMHLAHRHHNPAHLGIRTKEYKLIYYYGRALDATDAVNIDTPQGFELYDMVNDPYELHNIYDSSPDVLPDLMAKLHEARIKFKDTDEDYKDIVNI
ncbi:MAG: sulfatase [Clostridia bacterium]